MLRKDSQIKLMLDLVKSNSIFFIKYNYKSHDEN